MSSVDHSESATLDTNETETQDDTSVHRRRSPHETQNIIVLTTPPGSGTVTPREALIQEPRPDKKLDVFKTLMAALISIIVLALAFAGIFTNFGYVPCSCDSLRPYFIGLVPAILAWWAPSPLKS